MASTPETSDLIAFRRDLHERPEPAWREFYTTARIIEALRERDVDGIHYGRDVHRADARMNVPDEAELAEWYDRALAAGADPEILEALQGGFTGAIAVIERGDGPTIGLRVDIDGLPIAESSEAGHVPADEGFRSKHDGYMHACGHDAHATFGLGVIDEILASEFSGTLKVFFQPGEELIVGGKPMAESGHLDDVDSLFAVHIGLDHPTGEVIAGIDGFLAVRHFFAEFSGEPAHAGGHPEQGKNTVQALATAVQNLYGIPRHADGATRVNAGIVGGGTATNIIPEESFIEGEVRGETTDLADYAYEKAERVLESAATMHECEVDIETRGEAPSAESDQELVDVVAEVARDVSGVTNLLERDELGGSEDATYLMQRVQDNGGYATYVGIGTDHPGGHHTGTFDVDEESIEIGIEVLSGAVLAVAERGVETE
ncbi:aminobenzoyl-glutamate utilization protein A [Halalkaliarchaeum desulfuricum]|uniref:Aminobenzoyl-glutamate utilization protein A n=1 Tax=Halalkaliarchaeum desulfuricum TaxID=2055893 RepID=A0A343TJ00_9EURY|nr:amidohydrolase [Halalkaliarchaeum desulfuricum]AUX09072.1 aminobenzoyl-glutamate utilization protein A [Halalkaliarchaeum desulfuricum]